MATIITIDEAGTVTLPPEARERLHVRGRTALAVEVVGEGVLLRPIGPPEAEGEAPALRDVSRAFLRELIRRADDVNASGREVTAGELASWIDEGEAQGSLRRVPAR
jgi:AbrB family looped-hinge helix DNA binding protein